MEPSSSADSVTKHFAWMFSGGMKMGVNSFRCLREKIQFRVTRVEMSTWEAEVI